jgi:protein-disulfide isomerase
LTALGAIAVVAVATPMVFIPPYWQHPGWIELPELPTGVDGNGCHWIGAKHPTVVVVEFSDYQCPHCRRAHKQMRLEAAKFPDEVRLIHNHMPLDRACNEDIKRPFHDRACEFSKAAECAAAQGKFWQMNDALFSIQERVRTNDVDVERLAVQIDLDRSVFRDCMAEEGIPDIIRSDLEKSRALNVLGTPTFFIRSQPYLGGLPEGTLEAAVLQERQRGE